MHHNFDTQTADWRSEWPSWDESEDQSTDRICATKPDHVWCRLWLKDRGLQAISQWGAESNLMTSIRATGDQAEEASDRTLDTLPEDDEKNIRKSIRATGDQADDAANRTLDALPEVNKESAPMKSIRATGDQADEAAQRTSGALPDLEFAQVAKGTKRMKGGFGSDSDALGVYAE